MKWPDELAVQVEELDGTWLVTMAGTLCARSAATTHTALRKMLLDRGRLIVDASDVSLQSFAQLSLFPSVLAGAGGWPTARLVLQLPAGENAEGMRQTGGAKEVPVAADRAEALALLDRRPERVRRTTALPATAAAASFSRALVEVAGEDWSLPQHVLERLAIVTSELVSNAVEHTAGEGELTLSLDSAGVRVSVRDGSHALPRTGQPRRYGLILVDQLSERWGVSPRLDGKSVWALLRSDLEDEEF